MTAQRSPTPDTLTARAGALTRLLRRRGKLAAGLMLGFFFYAVALLADFVAPYDYKTQWRREPSAPAALIRFRDAEGRFSLRPHVYRQRLADPLTRRYTEDPATPPAPLVLFPRGYSYKLLGLLPTDRHLFGGRADAVVEAPRVYLLGTDHLGRDRFSRLVIASRFSLFVGPLGTLLASLLGVALGCLAAYAQGLLDALLMRLADIIMALPTLIIILAARAAFPLELPPARAATLLVMIFAALGWAEMARLTRGLVLALRRREFVTAAESLGVRPARILLRHILPNAARPLIVQTSLMFPTFLLAEAALSFLGVGLQEPAPSWGNMLAAAADLSLLRSHALLLLTPAITIFLVTLGARLIADGLKGEGGANET